jgi:hypothetical protein
MLHFLYHIYSIFFHVLIIFSKYYLQLTNVRFVNYLHDKNQFPETSHHFLMESNQN